MGKRIGAPILWSGIGVVALVLGGLAVWASGILDGSDEAERSVAATATTDPEPEAKVADATTTTTTTSTTEPEPERLCGSDELIGAPGGLLAERQQRGSITIGVAGEIPFGYITPSGEPSGIAPDVAREVLSCLGIDDVDAVVLEFGSLISGLQAGQFDILAAGMYITPGRAEQILFSDPDYCIAESLAVAPGNPLGIVDYQSIVDNPSIRVAVASYTVEVLYLEDAGVDQDQVIEFADIDSMYDALVAGEVDAVTGTTSVVQGHAAAHPGIESVNPFFPLDSAGNQVLSCGGFGFRLQDQELRDSFNLALNELRENGTTIDLITAYEEFAEADVRLANRLTFEHFIR